MNFYVENSPSKRIFSLLILCNRILGPVQDIFYFHSSIISFAPFFVYLIKLLCNAMKKGINMKNLLKFTRRYKVSRLASWLTNSGRNVISPTTISKFPAYYVAGCLQSYIRLMTRCLHFVVAMTCHSVATKGCLASLMKAINP